jgi:hypothetical protein
MLGVGSPNLSPPRTESCWNVTGSFPVRPCDEFHQEPALTASIPGALIAPVRGRVTVRTRASANRGQSQNLQRHIERWHPAQPGEPLLPVPEFLPPQSDITFKQLW